MPSFLSLFRRKENRKEAKEREKPNPFIMKKKQGKGKSPTLTDIFLKGIINENQKKQNGRCQ